MVEMSDECLGFGLVQRVKPVCWDLRTGFIFLRSHFQKCWFQDGGVKSSDIVMCIKLQLGYDMMGLGLQFDWLALRFSWLYILLF